MPHRNPARRPLRHPLAESSEVTADRIYLDNAATSYPKPEVVYAAADDWQRNNGTAFGRGHHEQSEATAAVVESCRRRAAQLLMLPEHPQPAFTLNCTDSLNLFLFGFVRPGMRVICSDLDHNSVLRPLERLRTDAGIELVRLPFSPGSGTIDPEDLRQQLSARKTDLVCLNHASNVTGCIQPITELAAAAKEAGAVVLLDAAQTAGHIPLQISDSHVDVVAAAGHKGLLGPLGTGILWMSQEVVQRTRPVRCGGTGTVSESLTQPNSMPELAESGNLNMPGIAGLNAGLGYIAEQGIEKLRCHAAELSSRFEALLAEDPKIRVYCRERQGGRTRDRHVAVTAVSIAGFDAREAAAVLEQSFGIQCRSGLHCAPLVHETLGTISCGGTLRFSFGWANTLSDAERTADALQQLAASVS